MSWTDFNDAPSPASHHPAHERETVRQSLLDRLESVLFALFPHGKVRRGKFILGDVSGAAGDSLEVALGQDKAGLWIDHASGEGGDVFDLIAHHFHLDVQGEFARVLERAGELLGQAPTATVPARRRYEPPMDDLGPPTAKWDYRTVDGQLIGCVYRYDPPGRGKEFRPWDAQRRKLAPPSPRPLYNQPGIHDASEVILVEGEKCADALNAAGYCATTAMHGANAPVDKTDWSPLAGKQVLVWPDKDKPGWDYALLAGEAILRAGAISCSLLLPPENQPQGWDVADALLDNFDVMGFLRAGERMPLSLPERVQAINFEGYDWRTEDGLALAFTARYRDDWRYCNVWGQWLVWSGQRWNPDRTQSVMHLARGVCRVASERAEAPSLRARLTRTSTVLAVERLARTDRAHAAIPEEWDTHPWLLNTPGGIVNLRDGVLREHQREARITRITTATPRPGHAPHWERYLDDATGGNVELKRYLQRAVGYCLTGVTTEHALFFLYGTGANGKSVFVNTLSTILGEYAVTAPMDTFMDARSDRHPTDLAGLRSARLVVASETEQGRRLSEAKIKSITGGEKITARFMRQDYFEYVPEFKLFIAGNHKPVIRNVDEAMKRRLHLIPFTVTIPPERRDHQLVEKLLAERDAILTWAIEGCLQWQQVGLQPPQCVLEATQEYFEAEDANGRWIDERCYVDPSARAMTSDLYADWKEWAETNGEFAGSIKRFSEMLVTRQFQKGRGAKGARLFNGISLKPKELGRHPGYLDN